MLGLPLALAGHVSRLAKREHPTHVQAVPPFRWSCWTGRAAHGHKARSAIGLEFRTAAGPRDHEVQRAIRRCCVVTDVAIRMWNRDCNTDVGSASQCRTGLLMNVAGAWHLTARVLRSFSNRVEYTQSEIMEKVAQIRNTLPISMV